MCQPRDDDITINKQTNRQTRLRSFFDLHSLYFFLRFHSHIHMLHKCVWVWVWVCFLLFCICCTIQNYHTSFNPNEWIAWEKIHNITHNLPKPYTIFLCDNCNSVDWIHIDHTFPYNAENKHCNEQCECDLRKSWAFKRYKSRQYYKQLLISCWRFIFIIIIISYLFSYTFMTSCWLSAHLIVSIVTFEWRKVFECYELLFPPYALMPFDSYLLLSLSISCSYTQLVITARNFHNF